MKKQVLKILVVTCLISISVFWYACQKESDNFENVEVSFNVISKSTSNLKSTQAYDLIDADRIIITVQESDGSPTDYTQYELKVYKMGDSFITNKITLPFGEYKVTEFYVVNDSDSITFACPIEDSPMDFNVSDALPVFFDVMEKESEAVDIEVISTENLEPEDFGLIRFVLTEVKTFQFLMNVSELGTDKLLDADLTVLSGGYFYAQDLDSIVDNIVTLRDGFDDYTLLVDKLGYQLYFNIFTNAELKQYDSIPLVVELELQ